MPKLTENEVKKSLKAVPEWSKVGEEIQRTFKFKNFAESMKFVGRLAEQAEKDQHHPDILIRWNLVTLTLTTHDAGGISEKDFALAKKADQFSIETTPPIDPPTKATATAVRSGKVTK
jgi:4a-hydroxytetrahydrobiopterin dehydratase